MSSSLILWFKECSYKNKDIVGGKCSSLGELYYLSRDITFDIADGLYAPRKRLARHLFVFNLQLPP